MTQGIRIEIDEGLSMVELPEAGDHLGFINLPKNSQFIVDDSENYFAIEMRHGKSSLVLMLERDQYESLIYELGFGPTSNRGTYGRLQKLIDENGCLRVQTRAKQLYELDKEAGGSNHRSHNFKNGSPARRLYRVSGLGTIKTICRGTNTGIRQLNLVGLRHLLYADVAVVTKWLSPWTHRPRV